MGRKLKISPGELSQIYRKILREDEKFNVYYEIARKNTSGKIWVIGSYLYGNILKELYGISKPDKSDVDLLVETPFQSFPPLEGWEQGFTKYGDLKIWRGDERVDFNFLTNIRSIIRKRISSPKIWNFLDGTPFNVDSLAYDTQSHQIVGEKGIEAFRTRILEINDYESMKESKPAEMKTMQFLKSKASGLEFRVRIDPALRSIIVMDEKVSPLYKKSNSQEA